MTLKWPVMLLLVGLADPANADLSFSDPDPVAITFTGFSGSGFSPEPSAGQLDSDNWIVSGLSDGTLTWGGTKASGDFARGSRIFGATTGGIYAFTDSPGGNCLGVQPTSDDFTLGAFTLRLRNDIAPPLIGFTIAYRIYCYNDEARANSFKFAFSTNGLDTCLVPDLDYISPELADGTLTNVARQTTQMDLRVESGGHLYLIWSGGDEGGSESRDEFALDEIVITPIWGHAPSVLYVWADSPAPAPPKETN